MGGIAEGAIGVSCFAFVEMRVGQLDRSPKDHQKHAKNGRGALQHLPDRRLALIANHDSQYYSAAGNTLARPLPGNGSPPCDESRVNLSRAGPPTATEAGRLHNEKRARMVLPAVMPSLSTIRSMHGCCRTSTDGPIRSRSAAAIRLETKFPRSTPSWSIGLLLAFAVVFWGLHYKLSLYHPASLAAHAPAAKLLSQKERPTASVNPEQSVTTGKPVDPASHPTVAPMFVALVLVALAGLLYGYWVFCEPNEDARRLPAIAAQSSPRAPPITA